MRKSNNARRVNVLGRSPALLTVLLMASALTTAACGDDSKDTADAKPTANALASIKLATVPIAGTAAAFIAKDDGYFRDEGLSFKANFLRFTPDIVASTVGGSSDFGIINTVTLLQALARNVPVKVVAPAYFANAAEQGIYVKSGSAIKSVKDLAGKRVAVVGLKNIQQLLLMALARDAGVDQSTIRFVEVPAPSMADTLKSGKVDAAAMVEPFITLAGGALTQIVDDLYAPLGSEHPIVAYYITSKRYEAKHADVVERFKKAILKAQARASSDPGSIRKTMAGYTEVPAKTLAVMALPSFGTSFDEPSFQKAADLGKQFKFLDEVPNLDSVLK
jgi:NitT/TauT family transport system substrate-binding protein